MARELAVRAPRHILVATDLSPGAERALDRAARLAAEHEAGLVLVHVIEDRWMPQAWVRRIGAGTEARLRQTIDALARTTGLMAAMTVRRGRPAAEILRAAEETGSDLIVVGAHGERVIATLLIGSTAEQVVSRGERPVLIVKRAARAPYRRGLVAVDFDAASREALRFALALAPGATVDVLHADDLFPESRLRLGGVSARDIARHRQATARRVRRELKAFVENVARDGRLIRPLVAHGQAVPAICTTAARWRADLLVVGTAARRGLSYLLLGSVAEHVVREARCDVLVARRRAGR